MLWDYTGHKPILALAPNKHPKTVIGMNANLRKNVSYQKSSDIHHDKRLKTETSMFVKGCIIPTTGLTVRWKIRWSFCSLGKYQVEPIMPEDQDHSVSLWLSYRALHVCHTQWTFELNWIDSRGRIKEGWEVSYKRIIPFFSANFTKLRRRWAVLKVCPLSLWKLFTIMLSCQSSRNLVFCLCSDFIVCLAFIHSVYECSVMWWKW